MTGARIRLSAAVMAHPRRAAAARGLAAGHPELDLRVVLDPEPDGPPTALRTALAAWSAVRPEATHHLVLQDDALPVPDFPTRLNDLIADFPEDALCLFTEWGSRTAHAVRLAALLGHTVAPVVDDYTPCVALVLPARLAEGFAAHARERAAAGTPDDVALLDYLAERGTRTLIPVGNLADHRNEASLVGNNVLGHRSAVCLLPPPAGPASLLEDLEAIPYYDFWGQYADICLPDPGTVDGWARSSARVALEQRGIGQHTLAEQLAAVLKREPDGARLTDRLGGIPLTEVWIVAVLLGVLAAERGGRSGRPVDLESPQARAALATLGPGAVRRVVPERWLPRIGALLAPVVLGGVRFGLRAASPAPLPAGQ